MIALQNTLNYNPMLDTIGEESQEVSMESKEVKFKSQSNSNSYHTANGDSLTEKVLESMVLKSNLGQNDMISMGHNNQMVDSNFTFQQIPLPNVQKEKIPNKVIFDMSKENQKEEVKRDSFVQNNIN